MIEFILEVVFVVVKAPSVVVILFGVSVVVVVVDKTGSSGVCGEKKADLAVNILHWNYFLREKMNDLAQAVVAAKPFTKTEIDPLTTVYIANKCEFPIALFIRPQASIAQISSNTLLLLSSIIRLSLLPVAVVGDTFI